MADSGSWTEKKEGNESSEELVPFGGGQQAEHDFNPLGTAVSDVERPLDEISHDVSLGSLSVDALDGNSTVHAKNWARDPHITPDLDGRVDSDELLQLGSVHGGQIGNYRILALLGRGGMGIVYKARWEPSNKTVAIKVMSRRCEADDMARFLREVKAVTKLVHPHIIRVYDVGVLRGRYYYAMQYVEGRNFDELIASKTLTLRYKVRVLQQVAQALHYAHGEGFIHRDVKPENILISPAGEPYLCDFGLAKEQGKDTHVTSDGTVVGTPLYMAPEMARGKREQVGPGVDIFALGAMLYQVLTGKPPHQRDSVYKIMWSTIHETPEPPRRIDSTVPEALEIVSLRALEKNIRKRYATAGNFADNLNFWLNGEELPQQSPLPNLSLAGRWPWLAAVLLVLVLVAGWWALVPGERQARVELTGTPGLERVRVFDDQGQLVYEHAMPAVGEQLGLSLAPGDYRVVVETSSGRERERALELAEGAHEPLTWKQTGILELQTLRGAFSWSFSGPEERTFSGNSGRIELEEGSYALRLEAVGFLPLHTQVEVQPGVSLPVSLSPRRVAERRVLLPAAATGNCVAWNADADPELEIVAGLQDGRVVIVDSDGRELSNFSGEFNPFEAHVHDLDQDGHLDLLLQAPAGLFWKRGGSVEGTLRFVEGTGRISNPVVATFARLPELCFSADNGEVQRMVFAAGGHEPNGSFGLRATQIAPMAGSLLGIFGHDLLLGKPGREATLLWQAPSNLTSLAASAALDVLAVGYARGAALLASDGRLLCKLSERRCLTNPLLLATAAGGRVLLQEEGGRLCLFDLKGQLVWERQLASPALPDAAMADLNADGQPEIVLIGSDGRVQVLHASDGSVQWSYQLGSAEQVVGNGAMLADTDADGYPEVMITLAGGQLLLLQAEHPERVWSYTPEAPLSASPLCRADGRVVVSERGAGLICIEQGRELWQLGIEATGRPTALPGQPERMLVPGADSVWLVAQGSVEKSRFFRMPPGASLAAADTPQGPVCVGYHNNFLYHFNQDIDVLSRHLLPGTPSHTPDLVAGEDDLLAFTIASSGDRATAVLISLTRMRVLRSRSEAFDEGRNRLVQPAVGAPVIVSLQGSPGFLFGNADGFEWVAANFDGQVLWRETSVSARFEQPVVAGDFTLLSVDIAGTRELRCMRFPDAEPVWRLSLPSSPSASLCLWGDRLALPIEGELWIVSVDDGRLLRRISLKERIVDVTACDDFWLALSAQNQLQALKRLPRPSESWFGSEGGLDVGRSYSP